MDNMMLVIVIVIGLLIAFMLGCKTGNEFPTVIGFHPNPNIDEDYCIRNPHDIDCRDRRGPIQPDPRHVDSPWLNNGQM
uniref:Uncharacterized protein n=1 Tax=Mimivirus LCMiAC02 TaxID=2506609 RepID=A0A481Z0F6_9VIRU|nr:MAG: hypothetical protein LCMiAC02_00860 [Mimivirus LCMiAC02]